MKKLASRNPITARCLIRRSQRCLCAALLLLHCMASTGSAEEVIRFGTGGSDGSYFPVGTLIAGEINRRTSLLLPEDALLVLPQRSNGSVANIRDLSSNLLEMGLAQADVVSLAYQGKGQFEDNDAKETLRTIGTLYQESVHLVVGAGSGINMLSDLTGKRVSIDELGSGTQFDAVRILEAAGVSQEDMKTIYLKPSDSIERMRQGRLDAIFIVAGYPVAGVKQLVDDGVGRVVALDDDVITQLTGEHLYFSAHTIPADVYSSEQEVRTLSVSAQLIVRSDVNAETVYRVTAILWSDTTLASLTDGHPRGADINAKTALQGVGIPLHPGALRFYTEHGYNMQSLPQ